MSFTFDDRDEYQRKSIAENLAKLIDNNMDISPIVIDGNWGTGKTEFSLKFKNYLNEVHSSKKVIYIDAFKEDHCDDPLLSVTAAIASALPVPKQQALIKKAIPALKFASVTALKAGVSWVVKQETDTLADEFKEAIKDTSNAAIDGVMENIINEHINAEKNINALKEKIKELASENQIVIIIDELDRCRPNFSIEMLEKIKHIFDIENLYFILVTNLSQLKASVNHIYGNAVNSQSYLDKFIKYTLSIPETSKPDGHTAIHTSLTHWNGLVTTNPELEGVCLNLKIQIEELLTIRPLSLRETETFFRYFSIFQTISKDKIGNAKIPTWNITTLTSIYMYCFGEKRAISHFPSKESIRSLAKTLQIDEVSLSNVKTHQIPLYIYPLFAVIKENPELEPNLLGLEPIQMTSVEKLHESLNARVFNEFNTLKAIKKTFDTFSLI